ncbi:MAG: class I SAM-dependent methyltransferase [Patescibacteria group bacterium]
MINKIKKFFYELHRPMPLNDNFKDYDEYWKNRGFHAPSLHRAELISKHIKPNSTILDIGCGDGTMIDYLNKNNHPREIVGLDISKEAVDYVKSKGFAARVIDILSDDFNIFLEDKVYDYIIITEVLEHVQEPEKVITVVRNHFKDNVFVSVPNAGFFVHRIRLMFGKFPLVIIVQHVKEHIRFWTMRDFVYWANYHDYTVKKIIVSSSLLIKPLRFLEKLFPALFGNQLLYKLARKDK